MTKQRFRIGKCDKNIRKGMRDVVTGDHWGTIHIHVTGVMGLEGARVTYGGLFAPLIKVLIIKFIV
jgi:hypothetical protein